MSFFRVIHSGAVDVWHEGKLLDLLGPGDTFGHAAMLVGCPPMWSRVGVRSGRRSQ